MSSMLNPFWPIQSHNLIARCTNETLLVQDSLALFDNYCSREEESKFLARLPHSDKARTYAFVQSWAVAESWQENQRLALIIEHALTQQPIGLLVLFDKSLLDQPSKVECHFGISQDFSNQGLVSELLIALIKKLVQATGYQSLVSYCDRQHLVSQKVLLNCGFKQTELLPAHYFNPNQQAYIDCYGYCCHLK
ncbi:GNAT family N-acetyltransferase [Pelagibaculum spongiae]|nr:GNAT family protein [Pelagibaculum spongiae]